jgi:hypothetical protein
MTNKLLKWAAIGGGAWLLYRYLAKPATPEKPLSEQPANRNPDYEYNTGNPNAPVGQDVNRAGGWQVIRPGF